MIIADKNTNYDKKMDGDIDIILAVILPSFGQAIMT
jgi:hypothetical protein